MKRFPILLGAASLILTVACSHEQAAVTRGIGVYPGKPDSRIHFDAGAPTVRVDFRGMNVAADRIELLGSATFPADRDKAASLTLLASSDGSSWKELGKASAAKLFAPPSPPCPFNMSTPVQEGPSPVKFLYDYQPVEADRPEAFPFGMMNPGSARPVNRTISCVLDLKAADGYESYCYAFNLPEATAFSLHTVNYYKDGKLLDVLPSATLFASGA